VGDLRESMRLFWGALRHRIVLLVFGVLLGLFTLYQALQPSLGWPAVVAIPVPALVLVLAGVFGRGRILGLPRSAH